MAPDEMESETNPQADSEEPADPFDHLPKWFRKELLDKKRRDEDWLAASGERFKRHCIKTTVIGFALSFLSGLFVGPPHPIFLILLPICGAVAAYIIVRKQLGYFLGPAVFTLPQLVLAIGAIKLLRVQPSPIGVTTMFFGWLLCILFGILITYVADTGRWLTG